MAVQHVDDNVAQAKNFTFKCHRESSDIYAVNSIAFHPVQGTFATAGTSSCSGCRMLGCRMRVAWMPPTAFVSNDHRELLCCYLIILLMSGSAPVLDRLVLQHKILQR